MNEFDTQEEKAGKPEPSSAPQGERQVPHLTLETDLPEDQPKEQDQHFPGSSAGDFHMPEPPQAPQPPGSPPYTNQEAYQQYQAPPQYTQPDYTQSAQPHPDYTQPGYGGYQPPQYSQSSPYGQPYQQPYYQYVPTPPPGYHQKSRMAAGLLAILLGVLGVHNFYLGFTSRGVVQLVVSLVGGILTCGMATLAVWIWAFIEGVLLLSGSRSRMFDGNGVSLID